MQIDFITFLQTMMQSQGFALRMFSSPFSNLEEIDFGLRHQLFVNFDYTKYFMPLFQECKEQSICLFSDDFDTHFALFQFPNAEKDAPAPCYVVIGPYTTTPMTSVRFFEITQTLSIPQTLHRDLLEYYNSLSLMPENSMDNLLNSIAMMIFEGTKNYKQVTLDRQMHLIPDELEFNLSSESELAMSIVEQRYHMEDHLLYAVQCGDTNKALDLYNQFLSFKLLPRSPDILRNAKNLMFVLNTLLRKAVQKSYVHPYHIDDLSAQLAIKIEAMTTLSQSHSLAREMIRKYCNLVQNYSLKNYSPLIQKVLNHVDFHYAEVMSLKVLASLFSVSPSYLSGLFKKETGSTLTDYINQKRIEHSLILLNTTSLPIQSIAEQVGFSDVNYFTRTFKKFKEMSPREYRMKIQQL
ncbi:MAG: helix-turn-helix domain-containing protein [bacterium]|nr:helix-turn-helix domain-containing protein [bacterium]